MFTVDIVSLTILYCYNQNVNFTDGEDELRRKTYEIKNNTFQPTIVAYEIDSNETDLIPPSDEDFHAENPLLQLQQESARGFHVHLIKNIISITSCSSDYVYL